MRKIMKFAVPVSAAAIAISGVVAFAASPASAGAKSAPTKANAALPTGTQQYPLEIDVSGIAYPLESYKFNLAKTTTGRAKYGDVTLKLAVSSTTPALFGDFVSGRELGTVHVMSSVVGEGDLNYTTVKYTFSSGLFVTSDSAGTSAANSNVESIAMKFLNVSLTYTTPPVT
jgi:type VI protein secretion system component Hcp